MSYHITLNPASTSFSSSVSSADAMTNIPSSEQTSQLLQRLREAAGAAGADGDGAIKIQTNQPTVLEQIIAFPFQADQEGNSATCSLSAGAQAKICPRKAKKYGRRLRRGGNSGSRLERKVKVMKLPSSSYALFESVGLGEATTTTTVQIENNLSQQVLIPALVTFNAFIPSEQLEDLNNMISSPEMTSRKRSDIALDAFSDAKRKKLDVGGKGLRHFSLKVCEKVQAKGSTSYNEVADELVAELRDPLCYSLTDQQFDQKNIRRRVYDALNVLMAMNIITKDKKQIQWVGLPVNPVQQVNALEVDKTQRMERIQVKAQQLQELIVQQIALKNLVERNRAREKVEGAPAPNSVIHVPFIIASTSKNTVIDFSMSNDKTEYLFNFDDIFEIHDETEVLKRMGLGLGFEHGQVTSENLIKARKLVPRTLEQYVVQLAENGFGSFHGMPQVSADSTAYKHSIVDANMVGHADDMDSDSDVLTS